MKRPFESKRQKRKICYISEVVRKDLSRLAPEQEVRLVKICLLTSPYGVHTYIYPTLGKTGNGVRFAVIFESLEGKILVREVNGMRGLQGILGRVWQMTKVLVDLLKLGRWLD